MGLTESPAQIRIQDSKSLSKFDIFYWKNLLDTGFGTLLEDIPQSKIEKVREARAYREIGNLLREILSPEQYTRLFAIESHSGAKAR